MRLLITGSREMSDCMAGIVTGAILRAKHEGISIIVGDAPGVDAEVIVCCDRLGVPIEVHGAYGKLRHKSEQGNSVAHTCSYLERDRIMAGLCDECIAVWDGKSRGTAYTAEYARSRHKPTHIWNDAIGQWQ